MMVLRQTAPRVPDREIADPALGKAGNSNARVITTVDAEAFRRCLKQLLLERSQGEFRA